MFDLGALQAVVAQHGRVVRLVVARAEGSAPREVGAAMLVWADGTLGTIGGGALEWAMIAEARALLAVGGRRLVRLALGPALGQCCGGAVSVVSEVYDAAGVAALAGRAVIARPVLAGPVPAGPVPAGAALAEAAMPLAVRRLLVQARGSGVMPQPLLVAGWMVEPVAVPQRQIWVWGAGHVGRALVAVLRPLPGLALTWVDVARRRFPDALPEGVASRWAAAPETLVADAPVGAEHLVATFSHALDLEICHRLLGHGFGGLGLIGSASKAARFASRLRALGHAQAAIGRIVCPIGDKRLGKHPQAIALGVAVALLQQKLSTETGIADDNGDWASDNWGQTAAGKGADQGLSGRGGQ